MTGQLMTRAPRNDIKSAAGWDLYRRTAAHHGIEVRVLTRWNRKAALVAARDAQWWTAALQDVVGELMTDRYGSEWLTRAPLNTTSTAAIAEAMDLTGPAPASTPGLDTLGMQTLGIEVLLPADFWADLFDPATVDHRLGQELLACFPRFPGTLDHLHSKIRSAQRFCAHVREGLPMFLPRVRAYHEDMLTLLAHLDLGTAEEVRRQSRLLPVLAAAPVPIEY